MNVIHDDRSNLNSCSESTHIIPGDFLTVAWWRATRFLAMALTFVLCTGSAANARGQNELSLAQRAGQATLYALPLVIMDVTRHESLAAPGALPNQFLDKRTLSDASSTLVIRPNVDTLYSNAWLDLSAGPVLLTVPASNGRFFMIQCMDAWTNVFADPGIRTLGNKAVTYAILAPGWHGPLPAGVVTLQSPTPYAWILARVYVRDDADLEAARAFQASLTVVPLSSTPAAPISAHHPGTRLQGSHRPTMMELLTKASPEVFFNRFLKLAADNPPVPNDPAFVENVLEPLGLAGRTPKSWQTLTPEVRDALTNAYGGIVKMLSDRAALETSNQRKVNGWTSLGDNPHGNFGTNYAVRAAVAAFGLAAKVEADGTTFNAISDEAGNRLDGSKVYRLTFQKGQTPPTHAFWSVTLYNDKGYLVSNSLNRYDVNSGQNLTYEEDGSLIIYLQPDDPGVEHRANWIPTSPSQMYELALRCYWPGDAILKHQWTPPPVVASK